MEQQQGRKILRIGIIQGGKIIEERLLRKREPVTVGEDIKNTFQIPNIGLPARFPLFLLKGDKYFLTMAAWMDGRLSLGTGVNTLQILQQRGVAKKVGQVDYTKPGSSSKKKVPVYQVPLSEKSRGKLTLGDVTLLFQFVTPPPLPAKPQLPAIIQSGWMKGFDWVYSTILILSFISHSGFVYWCHKKGAITGAVKLENISTRFAKLIVPKPEPKPKKVVAKTDDKNKNKDKKKKGKKKPKKRAVAKKPPKREVKKPAKRQSAEDKARAKAKRRQEIAKQVSNRGLLHALIGTKGSGSGSTFDAIGGGNVIDKVSQATKGLKGGIGFADGSSKTTRRRGAKGGNRALTTGAGVGKGPKGGSGSGIKTRRKIRRISGRMKIQKIDQEEGGSLDSGSLSRMIRRKSGQIRFCYERELRKNTSLRGKISLRVVVLPRGRVRKVEVEDNDLNTSVASCLKSRIKRWRFPKPKGGENATVLIPFFFQPSS